MLSCYSDRLAKSAFSSGRVSVPRLHRGDSEMQEKQRWRIHTSARRKHPVASSQVVELNLPVHTASHILFFLKVINHSGANITAECQNKTSCKRIRAKKDSLKVSDPKAQSTSIQQLVLWLSRLWALCNFI